MAQFSPNTGQPDADAADVELARPAALQAGAWVGPKGPPGLPPNRRACQPRETELRFANLYFLMNYPARALPRGAVMCWVFLWRELRPQL